MKFLIDADVPRSIGHLLKQRGHDVVDVRDLPGASRSDDEIYHLIQTEQRILVTRDLDFSNLLRYPPTPQCGLIVLRTARLAPAQVWHVLEELFAQIGPTPLTGALTIAQPGRYRIHRM